MSFYDIIRDCFSSDQFQWNCYAKNPSTNPLSHPERSYDFICEYFGNGAKEYAVNLTDECFIAPTNTCANSEALNANKLPALRISKYRAAHTVSSYFLGVFLEEKLKQLVGSVVIRSDNCTFLFSYMWFLLCLYHDFGYIVEEHWSPQVCEKSSKLSPSSIGFFELEKILKALGINYTPNKINSYANRSPSTKRWPPFKAQELGWELLELCPSLSLNFDCGAHITKFTYSTNIIHKYFLYCINELSKPVYNHGIIGGYLFFDRMVKNYLTAYIDYCRSQEESPPPLDNFTWNDKHFSIDQIPLFAYLADCIIAHNIWKADSHSEEIYIKYGLSKLVGPQFRKISFHTNPLLFFLAITDTLDPYKVYGVVSKEAKDALSIWKSIDYTINGSMLTVTSCDERYSIKQLFEKAKGLESWTEVTGAQLINDTSFRLNIIV